MVVTRPVLLQHKELDRMKLIHRAILVVAGLVVFTAGAVPQLAHAQSATPNDLAHQFVEARTRGDVEAALALLAPGATFQGAGQCAQAPCTGDAIRAQLVRETGLHIKVTVLNSDESDSSAALAVHVTNDRIRQCGAERVVSTETYTVADGKITSVVAAIDPTDEQSAKVLACPPPGSPPATTPSAAPGAPSTGSGLLATRADGASSLLFAGCVLTAAAVVLLVAARRWSR
jgi:hypothetical protein